ncbi:hypothetical protein KAR91_35640 [Candidatus Pacearchaeota archaeon]|nr:hypothetical protein [Candidatus Pacearchaeota archaeon]
MNIKTNEIYEVTIREHSDIIGFIFLKKDNSEEFLEYTTVEFIGFI